MLETPWMTINISQNQELKNKTMTNILKPDLDLLLFTIIKPFSFNKSYILINPFNAYNINQDSGAWVLILVGFWVLKLVFEWCRIHIKTVLAQHYSLVVFYPILLWFAYAWFIQATPVQVGPGQSQLARSPRFSQVLPGSPRFSQVLPGN